jgi:hypothetical protein
VNVRTVLGALAVTSLLLTGCAASVNPALGGSGPRASHPMPDGSEMAGAEHQTHTPGHRSVDGPSEAARMICSDQVVAAISKILGLDDVPVPAPSWDEPTFSCAFTVEHGPLVLSVHDVADVPDGEQHFADLQRSFPNAKDIGGLAGLGMPSFSTGTGIVAFLRDGKTLLVDAAALSSGLGPDRSRTQSQVAYAVASAVLVCWVNHP